MNLYPEDLGPRRRWTLIARRAKMENSSQPPASDAEPLGRLGRYWAKRTSAASDPHSARLTLRAARRALTGLRAASLPAFPALMIALVAVNDRHSDAMPEMTVMFSAVWLGLCWTKLPRTVFQRTHRRLYKTPLTAAEIAQLLPDAADELERTYLTLAMEMTRQEVAPQADEDLRGALRALGEAIDRLPATRVVGMDTDILTEVLRRTAVEALSQAQAEPDRIVAASLVRRAEALQRRADATHRASLLTRRFAALRHEMAAETEALRASLAAFHTGGAMHEVSALNHLAADVRRVAAEAAAVAAARDELDEFVVDSPAIPTLRQPGGDVSASASAAATTPSVQEAIMRLERG